MSVVGQFSLTAPDVVLSVKLKKLKMMMLTRASAIVRSDTTIAERDDITNGTPTQVFGVNEIFWPHQGRRSHSDLEKRLLPRL